MVEDVSIESSSLNERFPSVRWSAGPFEQRARIAWPSAHRVVRIEEVSLFWPTIKEMRSGGLELELWVGGFWQNGRTGRIAQFPPRKLFCASDWRVDPNDNTILQTEVFRLLHWQSAPPLWQMVIVTKAPPPPKWDDPWRPLIRHTKPYPQRSGRIIIVGYQ